MTPRLFLHIANLEARKTMSYRADFWINVVVSFFAQLGIVYFLWQAIFSESGSERIGGYDFDSMLLYYILVILLGKIVRGREHMGELSQDIYDGGLSRYLVYPAGYFRFKYAQHLGGLLPGAVQLLFFGLLAPLAIDLPPGESIRITNVLMATAALGVGNILFFLLNLPQQAVAFWADNVWSLAVLMRFLAALLGGMLLPLSLFPEWAVAVLNYLPFRYLYDFPVNLLLGRITPAGWITGMAVSLAWCGLLALAARVVWRRGELSYSGVGI